MGCAVQGCRAAAAEHFHFGTRADPVYDHVAPLSEGVLKLCNPNLIFLSTPLILSCACAGGGGRDLVSRAVQMYVELTCKITK